MDSRIREALEKLADPMTGYCSESGRGIARALLTAEPEPCDKQSLLFVDATPNDGYVTRILSAHIDNSYYSDNTLGFQPENPLVKQMNEWREQRNALLLDAISKLNAFTTAGPEPCVEKIMDDGRTLDQFVKDQYEPEPCESIKCSRCGDPIRVGICENCDTSAEPDIPYKYKDAVGDAAIIGEAIKRLHHWSSGWAGVARSLSTEVGHNALLALDRLIEASQASDKRSEELRARDVAGEVWDLLVEYLPAKGRTGIYDKMREKFPALAATEPKPQGKEA